MEPIYQNVLRYDEKENKWVLIKPEPFVALISPRFIEGNPIREDKNVENINDVRVSQLTEMVEVPEVLAVPKIKLEKSTLLARAVYEKGNDMVRKFMVWKTNKSLSNEYPEYIIYHLDYSKNRKEPLNRQMRITNDENQMWRYMMAGLKAKWLELKEP